MVLLSISAGAAIFCYRGEIMELLYVSGDSYSAAILGLMMLSFVCISLTYVFGSLLTANGSIRTLNIISLAGLLINVALNFTLIPREKALGAAIATVATQVAVLAAHLIAADRTFGIRWKERGWIYALMYIILVILANWGILQLQFTWPSKFLLSVLAGLLIALPSRLFSWSEVRLELRGLLTGSGRS
jgi:O-antigen/teichoic acid export membrane protein